MKEHIKSLAIQNGVVATAAIAAASIMIMLSSSALPMQAFAEEPTGETDDASATIFSDVNDDTPHAEDIAWLAKSDISTGWEEENGEATFRPEDLVLRQDMAAFLYRLAGSPEFEMDENNIPFTDVDANTPHAKEICWLASTGISQGWEVNGEKEFLPHEPVKRQDMAAFLHRVAQYMGYDYIGTRDTYFIDFNSDTPHYNDICWIAYNDISTGWITDKGRQFRGSQDIIRQDMAAFLHRLSDRTVEGAPEYQEGQKRILVIGDSWSDPWFGGYTPYGSKWYEYVGQHFEEPVVSYGASTYSFSINGRKFADRYAQFKTDACDEMPNIDKVVIMGGVNDLGGTTLGLTNNLAIENSIIPLVRNIKKDMPFADVMFAPTCRYDNLYFGNSEKEMYDRAASKLGVNAIYTRMYETVLSHSQEGSTMDGGDPMHPSAQGHRSIAERIIAGFEKL